MVEPQSGEYTKENDFLLCGKKEKLAKYVWLMKKRNVKGWKKIEKKLKVFLP